MTFFEKLNEAVNQNKSLHCVALNPDPEVWPKHIGSWEGISSRLWNVQEWLQLLIAETSDLICAYKLTLEFYRILGAPGQKLLSHFSAGIVHGDVSLLLVDSKSNT